MKESELMKFDWVMFDEENYEPYEISRVYMQIDHFNCGTVYGKTNRHSNGTYIAHCEEESMYSSREHRKVMPIPITPEILEKNGFEKVSSCDYKLPYNDSLAERGFYLENRVRGLYMITDHQLMHILYVHELQRVLRCCGLWNLADNFKLK